MRAASEAHPARAIVFEREATVETASVIDDDDVPELARGLLPGEAIWTERRLVLACSPGYLELGSIRPSGKKSMDARSFCAGIQGIKNETRTWSAIS